MNEISCREAGARLAERAEGVRRLWEERLQGEAPPAPPEPPVLLPRLPALLERLSQALREDRPHARFGPETWPEEADGPYPVLTKERLERLIHECRVLRAVLIELLTDRGSSLAPAARELVHAAVDREIEVAVEQFATAGERSLRRTRQHLSILTESTRDYAILTMDPQGVIRTWSPGAERVTGFSEREAIGQPAAILFTPEDRAAGVPEQELETARETGRANDERWQQRKDGSRYFASGVALALGEHAARGFAKVMRDATQRKRAEEERDRLFELEQLARAEERRSADRLRRVYAVTDVALGHLSLDALLQELLRRIQETLGVDTTAILLREGDELVVRAARGPETGEALRTRVPIGQGFAGRIAAERRPLSVADSREIEPGSSFLQEEGVLALLGVPLLHDQELLGVLRVGCRQRGTINGDSVQILELVADRVARAIERARLYDEAARRAERLQLLSDVAGLLLRSEDPRAFIDTLYRRLASHLGLEFYTHYLVPENGTGLRLEAYGGLPPEELQALHHLELGQQVCGRAALQRAPIVLERIQEHAAPGAELVHRLGLTAYACYPLLADDRVIGTLSFGTRTRQEFGADDLVLLETVTGQAAIALERARLNRELAQRASELAAADRRKDEFLATLAHELRNPLSGISNASFVLENMPENDPQRPRLRAIIRRQADHLSRMVDDLMDVSRITQQRIELRAEPVDLSAVVRQAVEAARPLVESRGHTLTVCLPNEPTCLQGDPTRLEQVVTNLLNNAAKYTENGGEIRLEVEDHSGELLLRVRDSGIGIAPSVLPHIFDLFTQAERTLDRASGGLGIGLTLVKRLVELHGGSVEARSPGLGAGSEFVVRLPALPGAAQRREPVVSTPPAELAPLRVLVVEDNRDAAESLADLLGLWGAEVRVVGDGGAALKAAGTAPPDVMLLDIGLPGMDGYELARNLRRLPGLRQVVLVALTGYGQDQDRHRSREAGFDHHLVKPVHPDELHRILKSVKDGGGAD